MHKDNIDFEFDHLIVVLILPPAGMPSDGFHKGYLFLNMLINDSDHDYNISCKFQCHLMQSQNTKTCHRRIVQHIPIIQGCVLLVKNGITKVESALKN